MASNLGVKSVIAEDADIYLDSACGPQDRGTIVEFRTDDNAGVANTQILTLVVTDKTAKRLQRALNDRLMQVVPNLCSERIVELVQDIMNRNDIHGFALPTETIADLGYIKQYAEKIKD